MLRISRRRWRSCGSVYRPCSTSRLSWFTATTRSSWVVRAGICSTRAKPLSRRSGISPPLAKIPLVSTKKLLSSTP